MDLQKKDLFPDWEAFEEEAIESGFPGMHDPFMNLEEEESKTHDKPTPSPSFEPFTGAEPEDVSDQITSMWEPPTPASEVSDLTRDNQSSLVSFGLNVILMATTSLVFLVGAQEQPWRTSLISYRYPRSL